MVQHQHGGGPGLLLGHLGHAGSDVFGFSGQLKKDIGVAFLIIQAHHHQAVFQMQRLPVAQLQLVGRLQLDLRTEQLAEHLAPAVTLPGLIALVALRHQVEGTPRHFLPVNIRAVAVNQLHGGIGDGADKTQRQQQAPVEPQENTIQASPSVTPRHRNAQAAPISLTNR